MVFALGAIVSIYQGILHIIHPEEMQDPMINYIVWVLRFCVKDSPGQWL